MSPLRGTRLDPSVMLHFSSGWVSPAGKWGRVVRVVCVQLAQFSLAEAQGRPAPAPCLAPCLRPIARVVWLVQPEARLPRLPAPRPRPARPRQEPVYK